MRVSWDVFLPEVVISTFALSVKLRLKADHDKLEPSAGTAVNLSLPQADFARMNFPHMNIC